MTALPISVPAGLYFFQNMILSIALKNLSAPVFQVTYQSKLVTTAIISVLLLNRQYQKIQWICLTLLGFGVAIVVLGEKSPETSEDEAGQSMFRRLDGRRGSERLVRLRGRLLREGF